MTDPATEPAGAVGNAQRAAAWDDHVARLIAANDDRGVDRPAADPCATPLIAIARELPPDAALATAARDVCFRIDASAIVTRRNSHEVWSALTRLDTMLSDIRRIEPRFACAQLSGAESIVAGNRYRIGLTDPAYLSRLNAAITSLARDYGSGTLNAPGQITVRRMDVQVVRGGPFGGETGGMVVETLDNHRLAGLGSFWAVVHGEDGELRISLEACELFRWNWAAERLADWRHAAPPGEDARILNWPWYFERVADALNAEPLNNSIQRLALVGPWHELGADPFLRTSLAPHPALGALAARLDAEP